VCDLETSRIGAPYIYDISSLRVNIYFRHMNNDVYHVYRLFTLKNDVQKNSVTKGFLFVIR